MEIVLPKLEPWQKDVFEAMLDSRGSGKRYIIKARRQCGKSVLAIVLLIKFSLEEKCINVCVEPTQAQSRRVFKQIVDCLQGSGVIKSANATLLTIEFINGSEILFKSQEQRDALRGFTVSGLLVIDEGAFITTDIYNILYPCCDANNAPILIISTPLFRSGEFYNLYSSSNDMVESFDWSTYDTSKYLSNEKLEYYRQTVTPLKFQSEYLGQFITEGSYIFGDIGSCVKYINKINSLPPKYGGIDWASGNGGDFTVLTLMSMDGKLVDIVAFKNMDPVTQVEKLAEVINGYSLDCLQVEMNSIGRIYYDQLRRKVKCHISQFNTTNDSKRKIIEQLVTAFQKQTITIPNDEELIKELQHYAMEKTSKGYTYNGADGVNDDYVMSLALCWDAYNKKKGNSTLSFV